jgi:hypothetical protein
LRYFYVVSSLPYGPVVVLGTDDNFRVGYYDDDHTEFIEDDNDAEEGEQFAVVYYCEPPFLFDTQLEYVNPERLAAVNTDCLIRRREVLSRQLVEANNEWARTTPMELDPVESYRLLLEYSYVAGLLADRMFDAREQEGHRGGRRIFISHSSTDKRTAISLSVDLASEGHMPWLDEWEIKAGESIPTKIGDGLEASDFVVVLMSRAAVDSGWVQAEWMTKYWDEIGARKVQVIPVLLEECSVPTLLRTKKYADLRWDYRRGLDQILDAIN